MNSLIEEKFWELVRQEGLEDPSWVVQLDDHDEPPLFTRLADVEFLRELSPMERGPVVLEMSLLLARRIAEFVSQTELPGQQRIFCCVTFADFPEWRRGEVLVPTPALDVRPHHERSPVAGCSFAPPRSRDGKEVSEWLQQIEPGLAAPFRVAELDLDDEDPDLHRVYVGWKENPSKHLVSIGPATPRTTAGFRGVVA